MMSHNLCTWSPVITVLLAFEAADTLHSEALTVWTMELLSTSVSHELFLPCCVC